MALIERDEPIDDALRMNPAQDVVENIEWARSQFPGHRLERLTSPLILGGNRHMEDSRFCPA
jgi:hypothetical protein